VISGGRDVRGENVRGVGLNGDELSMCTACKIPVADNARLKVTHIEFSKQTLSWEARQAQAAWVCDVSVPLH
jgi:hypothetical protein